LNLKRQIAGGALWSLVGSAGQQLLSFVVFIYLARVLSPNVFGIVAFGIIAADISGYVARWGQIELLQREADDREAREAAAFWIATAAGILTTLCMLLVAAVVSLIEGRGEIALVLLCLSPLALLQGLSVVPEALLRQRMQFRKLAIRNWVATAAGAGAAIWVASVKPGVEVLVAQRAVFAIAQFLILWLFTPVKLKLIAPRARLAVAARQGFQIVIAGLSAMINVRVADLITGAMLGARSLGLLRLGWRINDLISQVVIFPITSVALSSFSRLAHDEKALQRAYLRMTQLMALISLPLFFGAAAVSERLIEVVFGHQWVDAAIVLFALAPLAAAGTVNQFFNSMMLACGRPDIVMRQSITQTIVTIVMVAVAANSGIFAVLVAHCLRSFAVAAFNLFALKKVCGLASIRVLSVVIPPVVASIVMGSVVWRISQVTSVAGSASSVLGLAVMVILGGVLYPLGLLIGDSLKLWPGYCREVVRSLLDLRR